jgi:uncharacterized protein (DUF58 family)
MRWRVVPGRWVLMLLALGALPALLALVLGANLSTVAWYTAAWVVLLLMTAALDFLYSRSLWRLAAVRMTRHLPAAFAIGVPAVVRLQIDNQSQLDWQCDIFDRIASTLHCRGLPARLLLQRSKRLEYAYTLIPAARGVVSLLQADLRVRSRLGLCELLERVGVDEQRRVYPDFAQIARYAWLASDRRLQEIGIKTFQRRGEGTDFKQLSEYRYGDPVRHVDWKASLRLDKPVVREFQDERDQCILLLIDCGRRLRADDRQDGLGSTHFDQVLNAVMLLGYVALRQGDAVGAMTFGTSGDGGRFCAPSKGIHTLHALMAGLFDVQPSPAHSDYVSAARELLRRHAKRALVIVITNFRDEDSSELGAALRLLRTRHRVMLASLREQVVADLVNQPLTNRDSAFEIASAQLYEQARGDAFRLLSARDALLVDADPQNLGVELVNRYQAVKRSGML